MAVVKGSGKGKNKTVADLARRLADPGLRSKLPASALSPTQRAQRARNAAISKDDSNPLYDPSKQLAGHALALAANQTVDSTLQPQIAAADQQIANAKVQGGALAGRASDYYTQLAKEAAQGVARQQAISQMTNGAVAQTQAGARADLAGLQQGEQQRQADDAALRGGGLSGGPGAAESTLATAGSQQALLLPAQAAQIAAQGSSWDSLANAMAQARGLRGGEIQGELANQQGNQINKLATQRAALQASRGDLVAKQILGLRQSSFDNAVTQNGLNIKNDQIKATIQGQQTAAETAAANRKQAAADKAAGRAVTTRGQDISAKNAQAARDAARAAAEQKRIQGVRTASGKAWAPVEDLVPKLQGYVQTVPAPTPTDPKHTVTQWFQGRAPAGAKPATTEQTIAAMRAQKAPEWQIRAALDIRHQGFLSPATIDLIHRAAPEVRIPAKYRSRYQSGVAPTAAPRPAGGT